MSLFIIKPGHISSTKGLEEVEDLNDVPRRFDSRTELK